MPKRYSEEEIERGLVAAASLGTRKGGREVGLPESTIRGWIEQHPERWAEIRAQEAPKWRARAAAAFEDVVDRLSATERKLVDRMDASIPRLEPKDVGNALKSASLSKAINVDKANVMRDRPTATVEQRVNMAELDAAIRALRLEAEGGPPAVVDAVEVRELPEGEEL